MRDEVRYQMLRPQQIVDRRKAYAAVYIPIGTLEWHGVHNPLGADTLQAEGLAVRCAQQGGGLVFPPLYYGENRLEALMEVSAGDRDLIAQHMELSPDSFTAQRQPFSATEQTLSYNRLLLHILAEADSLGFALGVLVAGHAPLINHAQAAVLLYDQRQAGIVRRMLAWACVDHLLVRDRYPKSGDHAGGWETSHLIALHPEAVELSLLPPRGEPLVGVIGTMAPQDASAAFGEETLTAAAGVIVHEAQHRLAHPGLYSRSGQGRAKGRWRE